MGRLMFPDHSELMHAISEYGKAQEANGRAGGSHGVYVFKDGVAHEIEPPNRCPEFIAACEAWSDVLKKLNAHFYKSRFQKIVEALFYGW